MTSFSPKSSGVEAKNNEYTIVLSNTTDRMQATQETRHEGGNPNMGKERI
jgi:hypothetical protein